MPSFVEFEMLAENILNLIETSELQMVKQLVVNSKLF